MDAHYTPPLIADALAAALHKRASRSDACNQVGDVTVGDGALLEAIGRRAPSAGLFAFDLDRAAVRRVARRHPTWTTATVDALDPQALARRFEELPMPVTGLVLNPPFSHRGGSSVQTAYDAVRASPALAVLLNCVPHMPTDAVAACLLPANALHSEKDRTGRAALANLGTLHIEQSFDRNAFHRAYAKTTLVTFIRNSRQHLLQAATPPTTSLVAAKGPCRCLRVHRGRLPMHTAPSLSTPTGLPLIHTNQLRNGQLCPPTTHVTGTHALTGPAVLLPRVGRPDNSKIVTLPLGTTVVLSDCVLAISTPSLRAAQALARNLRNGWMAVEAAYAGSCAPYLTVDRLVQVLRSLGHEVHNYPDVACGRRMLSAVTVIR
jgi:hypothetical protein